MKRIYYLLLLFIVAFCAHAESNPYYYVLNAKHGLSSNRVQSITKDKFGFMWFATRYGLNRYDGHQLHHYDFSKHKNFELVTTDASGRVWAKSNASWCFYDMERDVLDPNMTPLLRKLGIKETVIDIHIDEDKNLWCLTKGHVYYYNYSKSQLSKYPKMQGMSRFVLSSRAGKAFFLDKNGEVKQLNLTTGKYSTVLRMSPAHAGNWQLYIDSFNRLWIYALNMSDIHCYDMATMKERAFKRNEEARNCAISQLIDDEDGYIWVATNVGIYKINGYDFTIEHIQKSSGSYASLTSNHILSIYKDKTGILWIGTGREGVCYQQLNCTSFVSYTLNTQEDITCMLQDNQGKIWLGTDGKGLLDWNLENSQSVLNTNNSQLTSDFMVCSYLDKEGNIWLGTYQRGVWVMKNHSFKPFLYPNSSLATSPINHVKAITSDPEGTIWFATNMNGLIGYTSEHHFMHFQKKNSVLNTNSMTDIYSRGQNLWIATSYGLYLMNVKTHKITPFIYQRRQPLAEEYIECVLEDSRGTVWIGTQNGMFVYDKANDQFTKLTIQDGLSHQHILGLMEDAQHHIWASTANGLTHILVVQDLNSQKNNYCCYPYTDVDGIGDITFKPRSIIRTHDDMIVVGGTGKILAFRPVATTNNPSSHSKVFFTDLHIANELIKPGLAMKNGRIVLDKSLYLLKEITVKYSDNNLVIDVSTMNYVDEHKLKYQYRLDKGTDWIDLDGNKVILNQLAYGTHLLEVRVKNNLGEHITPSILRIHVQPPFWLSIYAYIIYLILLGSVCFYAYKQYQAKLLKNQRKLQYKHQAEMNEAKMRFFTNVSHDLKTPLSLIMVPLEKIIKVNEQKNLTEDLFLMQRNVEILKSEVNQLLDFRKLDQQKEQYVPSYGSITEFVSEVCESFQPLVVNKGITCLIDTHGENIEMDFDKEKVQRILLNLLSNAYKYNVDHGTIEVDIQKLEKDDADYAMIQVKDTGIGIKEENKTRVFERFYQEKTTQTYIGNGIGLHIVKEYVRLHHGEITVSNNVPQGSIFTIMLPITHLQANLQNKKAEELINVENSVKQEDNVAQKQACKLLLVEDNDDFRHFLARTLSETYQICQASNGEEALEVMGNQEIDIVISDIMMPVMDGLQLCHKIKNDIRYSHIPVILLTARTTDEHILEGLKDGADEYITKPFNMDILLLRINKILEWTKSNHIKSKTMEVAPSEITVSSLDEQLLKDLIKYVEDHMSNEELSVEELSSAVGLSRGHLYKKLMSITGKSPIEFIRVLRIKRGKQLLEQSQQNISQIAFEVGMSPKQFSKFFKEEFGVLPSDYKKQNIRVED